MKRVVWFLTDLGFEATRQQLLKQRGDIIGDMELYKGAILTFYFKDLKDYTVQITNKGKLGISYPESANYQIVLEKLKPLLVRPEGSPIRKLEQIIKKASTEKIEDSFKASLMRHYQKMLAYAEQFYLEGEWLDSRDTLRLLVHELPQPQREKIEKQFRGILYSKYFNYLEIESLIAAIIEQLGHIYNSVAIESHKLNIHL
jgi:hypothetical protein